jgi:predicted amidophosphoribosyltransferase
VELRPAGFGQCGRCAYRQTGSAQRCWTCAATALGPALLDGVARCSVCDQPLGPAAECDNYWCRRDDRGFDVVWAVARHAGVLREVIARYKYRNTAGFGPVLGRVLAGYLLANSPCFEDIDLIVACPGRPPRDHVVAIVDAAAGFVGELWSFDTGPQRCVQKQRPTVPMMTAGSPASRRLWAACDLRPALVVPDRRRVCGRRILVIDDVFTDGSTLREIALALLAAGATGVSGLVLARQPWSRSINRT